VRQFLSWEKDELRTITLEHSRRKKGKQRSTKGVSIEFRIPAAYHRIVSQLVGEIVFATNNDIYEARRRQVYARQVLDFFGQELLRLKGYSPAAMVNFRSKVLTPILMRQLRGTDDAYAPFVHKAVQRKHQQLTIKAATEYYFGLDPVDPMWIPTYRRNLLYLPVARWYLGFLMHNPKGKETAPQYYKRILEDHDHILEALKVTGYRGNDKNRIPLLTKVEVLSVAEEGLSLFFKDELASLVRFICFHTPLPLFY
jgi:hypothetical protein